MKDSLDHGVSNRTKMLLTLQYSIISYRT